VLRQFAVENPATASLFPRVARTATPMLHMPSLYCS